MRAMRAETFTGYKALKLVDLPKPAVTDGRVLVRITAAGVTPLDYTILSGKFHIPEFAPPLSSAAALHKDRSTIDNDCLPRAESFLHQKQIGLCNIMSFANSPYGQTLLHAFKELLPF